MKPNQLISIVVLLIVFSIGSFFAGTKYQQKKTISNFRQFASTGNRQNSNNTANGNRTRPQNGGFMGGQNIGEITSIDDNSLTVKLTDGSSKIILISDSTSINQSTSASKSDLKVGTKVAVMGNTNTDGSITGKFIEINPKSFTLTSTPTQ